MGCHREEEKNVGLYANFTYFWGSITLEILKLEPWEFKFLKVDFAQIAGIHAYSDLNISGVIDPQEMVQYST